MKKQTESYNFYGKGMFAIIADTVAELREIGRRTGGQINVATFREIGNIDHFGSLICRPEDWQAVCQAEIDDNPEATDWDSAEETVCTEGCRKHYLAVLLGGNEWGIEGINIVRYQCSTCNQWHESEDSATECCE